MVTDVRVFASSFFIPDVVTIRQYYNPARYKNQVRSKKHVRRVRPFENHNHSLLKSFNFLFLALMTEYTNHYGADVL